MAVPVKREVSQLELPKGFRFHPTDEELVMHYLCPKAESQPFSIQIIADVDIYKFDPWNLPGMLPSSVYELLIGLECLYISA